MQKRVVLAERLEHTRRSIKGDSLSDGAQIQRAAGLGKPRVRRGELKDPRTGERPCTIQLSQVRFDVAKAQSLKDWGERRVKAALGHVTELNASGKNGERLWRQGDGRRSRPPKPCKVRVGSERAEAMMPKQDFVCRGLGRAAKKLSCGVSCGQDELKASAHRVHGMEHVPTFGGVQNVGMSVRRMRHDQSRVADMVAGSKA